MGFNLADYVPVADRLDKFRTDHPEWGLTSQLLYHDEKRVVVRALITNDLGREMASGHAEEIRNQGNVNKTSALENAETSAWGRALAALGYDVKGGIASREEMQKAERGQQNNRPKPQASKPAKPVDTATGEILPPVKQLLDALPAAQRAAVQAKLTEANYPPVEQLRGAAERQARRWIDDAKTDADKGAPF